MLFFMQDKNSLLFIFKFWYVNSRFAKKYTPYIDSIYVKGDVQRLFSSKQHIFFCF